MTRVYIGFGSNLGDREGQLTDALNLLAGTEGITLQAVSSFYETEPVGFTDQDQFLNAVAVLETTLAAEEVLKVCLAVEQQLHRVRTIRWGPRTVDIDMLLYGDSIIETPSLTLPHPRMGDRRFVLIPLAEVAPGVKWNGKTVEEHLAATSDRSAVKPLASS